VGTTVVLDTCVLLADPDSLYAFGDADIVIPLTVIEELDGHKNRLDDVGRAARAVVRDLERLRVESRGDFREPVDLPTGGTLRVAINGLVLETIAAHGLNPDKADNRILAAALGLTRDSGAGRVKIVSADAALRIKASQLGLAQVIFEAPRKSQQAWFVNHLGLDVNLGNIAAEEVLPLETLRLGLRADTVAAGA